MDPNQSIEEQQRAFAAMLDNAMKQALEGVNNTQALLQQERKAVEDELDAAKKAREAAERESEKLIAGYFEQRREQLIAFTRQELLRQLTRRHLEAGKPVEEICLWLNVEVDFVNQIATLMERQADYQYSQADTKRIKSDHSPRLYYTTQGRGGTIRFENNLTSFDMWWEYATSPALVLIGIPSEKHWEATTKLPVEQRADTLRFIGEQVVADHTSGGGSFVYDDQIMTIYNK
jgi:hypothetical protein